MSKNIPVGIVKREDDPLLKRFEEISSYVGLDSEAENTSKAVDDWYQSRKKTISESLMRALTRSSRDRRKFKIRTAEITFGSGKLASDVIERVVSDLAATGYECDVKSNHLYFWPMAR
jgi:hypothetical protein